MKLNARLILFSFVIVVVTSSASAIIYYSLTDSLFSRYQSQSILNSTNDFIFVFETALQQTEYDAKKIFSSVAKGMNSQKKFNKINLDSTSIDFMFTLENDSLINMNHFNRNKNSNINISSKSFRQFFIDNPNVILNYSSLNNGDIVYYGRVLDSNFLNKIAEKIRADVALIIDNEMVEISNPNKNHKYIPLINKLIQNLTSQTGLKFKNNYDIFNDQVENADFSASLYTPRQILTPGGKINFIIFSSFEEATDFRNTLRNVILLIVVAGSAITFISVLLFTYKFRKQISLLSEATEITAKGNLDHRVTIITKDEIGKLGEAFNRMLEVIKKKEDIEKQYTEFIKLINQNPTLKEVSEAALTRIIKSTDCTFGILYVVEQKSLRIISSYGINRNIVEPNHFPDLYVNAIDKKEIIEYIFQDNFPEIKSGLTSVKIKYLLIYPIVYNKETIAILELASGSVPLNDVKNYLSNIQEHLAIGLINAMSIEKLENLVVELKRLNEEYQKQNRQISQQNEELKELHKQLREKADELERQRSKAVKLTKVKSQFLASMSHELRTPLISILGLTELLLKDSYQPKSYDNSKINEKLNIVYRNGKKLLRLITNILEFSRLESGKIEVKKEKFLLSDFLEELKLNIEHAASEKNLKFIIDTPKGINLLLNTDKNKLDQILTNLLINAVKFTEKGEVKLLIELKENNALKFSVIDTGVGISEENKELIFSEFKQVDAEVSNQFDRSNQFGGAGLGLAICKRYVELLGGKLSLESKLGKGSNFSFELKDVVVELFELSDNFLKVESQIEELEGSSQTIKQKAALIIGSSENANKLIGDYLSSYDYKIFVGDNRLNGLETANKRKFNSIIISASIKDSSAWELIIDLKKNPLTQDIPIIVFNILEKEKVGWIPNVFDYVIKPIKESDINKLTERLQDFSNTQIEKIVFASHHETEFEIIKNMLVGTYAFGTNPIALEYRSTLESAMSLIDFSKPQLYLLDVESFKSDALLFSALLRQNRFTKNTYLVFLMPQNLLEEDLVDLNKALNAITLREKSHPLDILKFIKDRLQIDDSEANKRLNLMIETKGKEDISYKRESYLHNFNSLKPTVMIVDDDEDSLFTIGEFVKELNCNTIFAHNGMECLLTLNHIEPDLIFLDIMMPTMDGFETIRRIRSNNKTAHIPVIALTAYAMLENKEVIEKNGFNDLVTKPVDSTTIASKIQNFLKMKVV